VADIAVVAGSTAWAQSTANEPREPESNADPIENATQDDEVLPGFSMSAAEEEMEIQLEQFPFEIRGRKSVKRHRRTEVFYLLHFEGHEGQDVWVRDKTVRKYAEHAMHKFEASAEQRTSLMDGAEPRTQEDMESPAVGGE
jgi:hypothetical protein